MAARKAESFVEALRIDSTLMCQQFDQFAATAARFRNCPLHDLFADTEATAMRGHPHVLDQRARRALRTETRQNAKLEATDHSAALAFRDHQRDIRIALDPLKGREIE